jgi:ribosome assembly protein 1
MPGFSRSLFGGGSATLLQRPEALLGENPNVEISDLRDFETSIITGFQLATSAGPLCAEPVYGVCFFIENIESLAQDADQDSGGKTLWLDIETAKNVTEPFWLLARRGILSGQVIATVRDACRQAFLQWSPRLMLAMYSCDIQATGMAMLFAWPAWVNSKRLRLNC